MTSTDDFEQKWPRLNWWQVADRLAMQTFQVQRKACSGTSFMCGQGIEPKSPLRHYILATAWHVIEDILDDDDFTLFRRIDGTAIRGVTDNIMTARLGPMEFDLVEKRNRCLVVRFEDCL
jgi:hypothetical protein